MNTLINFNGMAIDFDLWYDWIHLHELSSEPDNLSRTRFDLLLLSDDLINDIFSYTHSGTFLDAFDFVTRSVDALFKFDNYLPHSSFFIHLALHLAMIRSSVLDGVADWHDDLFDLYEEISHCSNFGFLNPIDSDDFIKVFEPFIFYVKGSKEK